MVEQTIKLNNIFGSLSNTTRRDILTRVSKRSLNIGEIAKAYGLTFAAVAKHLKVLESAGLVSKTRKGKEQIVTIVPLGLASAENYLKNFETLWDKRLNRLDKLLTVNKW